MKKGFTLIELLAVIVILAVIALISIPMILGVIENSKLAAFKSSVLLSFSSAELYETNNTVSESGIEIKTLSMKNNNFKYGKIIKNVNNTFEAINVSDGNYCANGILTNLSVNKGECDKSIPTCTYEVISGNKGLNDWYITSPTLEFKTSKSDVSGLYYGVGVDENYESTILNNNDSKTLTSTIVTSVNTTTINGYVKSGADKKNTCSVTFKTDLIVPSAPIVNGTNTVWAKSRILILEEPLNKSGILKYEYYISETNTKPLDTVTVTGFTNSLVNEINTSGKYIYFRTVNNAGVTGPWSDAKDLYVDITLPVSNATVSGKVATINLSDNNGLVGYAVTESSVEPTSWTSITGTSSVQSYTATKGGTYYVWVKDIAGNVKSNTFVIDASVFAIPFSYYAEGHEYNRTTFSNTINVSGYTKLYLNKLQIGTWVAPDGVVQVYGYDKTGKQVWFYSRSNIDNGQDPTINTTYDISNMNTITFYGTISCEYYWGGIGISGSYY